MLKRLLCLCLVCTSIFVFSKELAVPIERFSVSRHPASLQNGAKLVVNYCMGCHTMQSVRLGSLSGLRLTDRQIKDNFLYPKGLDAMMDGAMPKTYAQQVFGIPVPDLSFIVKEKTTHGIRGEDWLYTYLQQFYWDLSRPLGWNNRLQNNTMMPHVLYALENSTMSLTLADGKRYVLNESREEKMTPLEYEEAVADIVNFLAYAAEPVIEVRYQIGFYIFGFLFLLFVLLYMVKVEFWKTVR